MGLGARLGRLPSPMEALLAGLEGRAAAEDGAVAPRDGHALKNDNDGAPT
jgi:hypothetical protein